MTTDRVASVDIPKEDQGALASLLRLTDPLLEGLEQSISKAHPTLDKDELVSQLRQEPQLAEVADLEEIVGALISIAGTSYSAGVKIDSIVEVVLAAIKNDDVVELKPEELTTLKERLLRLAGLPTLEIIAKGTLLLRANERTFRSAKIVTDFRPICSGDEANVVAGVIVHHLAVRARRNGRTESTFFVLDSNDLRDLTEVLTRAIKKEKSLKVFADRPQSPVLPPSPE